MKNFKKEGFKKGAKDFGGKPKFKGGSYGNDKRSSGGRDGSGRDRESFPAVCSTCKKNCTVPFKPNDAKPVLCSACFGMQKTRDEQGGNRDAYQRSGRPDYTKMPREDRPARHDPSRGQHEKDMVDIKRQLETLESRLNRVLDLLSPPKPPTKQKPAEETEAPVTEVKKERKPKTAKKIAKKATKKIAKKVARKTKK